MIDAKNRWVFVTGASRGVGRQIALALAEKGCNLLLHARKREHLETVAHEIGAFGVKTFLFEADLTQEASIRAMLEAIDATGVPVDFVWNNAGIQPPEHSNIWDTPIEDYFTAFQVNIFAPMIICYHFLPLMLQRGFGRILNVTSGIENKPELGAYSTSKGALTKFTRDLAPRLHGTGVSLHLTDPGWCRTDMAGPDAPNDVSTCIPGILVGAFLEGEESGQYFAAQDFTGLIFDDAVALAEKKVFSSESSVHAE